MKKTKYVLVSVIVLLVLLAVGVTGVLVAVNQKPLDLQSWKPGTESLTALREYVADVTDTASKNFIPPEDRIAVFDLDGTLFCEKAPTYVEWMMFIHRVLEDPTFQASEDLVAVAEEIVESIETGIIPDDMELKQALANAKAYENMTLKEYRTYANAFLTNEAVGFKGMTYAEAWYLPMLEVVDYLNKNDFIVYICSGTDRFMCRVLAEGMADIPERQIIGTDVFCVAAGQGDTDGLEYVYSANEEVVKSDQLILKNVKANKVSQIVQEIGAKPVLSFGNSSGDISTAVYTTTGNPYRSMAFMVVADDTEREYGDTEKAAQMRSKWDSYGWVSISMKDDWNTIYGDTVTKVAQK